MKIEGGLCTERVRLVTLSFVTERAGLGPFSGFGTERARLGPLETLALNFKTRHFESKF